MVAITNQYSEKSYKAVIEKKPHKNSFRRLQIEDQEHLRKQRVIYQKLY